MKTLTLESCRNKFNKKPWLAKLTLKAEDPKEFNYHFESPDETTYISGTRNEYQWDLEEDVLYSSGDTRNYSNYDITFFVIHNGKKRTLTKREARSYLKGELDLSVEAESDTE